MTLKFYVSNLNGNRIEKQKMQLSSYPDSQNAIFFVDEIDRRYMRGEYWKHLTDRANMLRPSGLPSFSNYPMKSMSCQVDKRWVNPLISFTFSRMRGCLRLRPTTRQEKDKIVVTGLSSIARVETDFRSVLSAIKARGAALVSLEEGENFNPIRSFGESVKRWKASKIYAKAINFQKHGARASADKRKAEIAEKFQVIADRWPLPSKGWPADKLLKEAKIGSRNSVNDLLGITREVIQGKYERAKKRGTEAKVIEFMRKAVKDAIGK